MDKHIAAMATAQSSSSSRRTRSSTASASAAADALIRLSRLGPNWVPAESAYLQTPADWRPAPPAADARHPSVDAIRDRFPTPPRMFQGPQIVPYWDNVPPGKQILSHLAQYLTDRFGAKSWGVRQVWSAMPFIAHPDGATGLSAGWTAHTDEVGRQYYYNLHTRTAQWVRPRAVNAAEDDPREAEDIREPTPPTAPTAPTAPTRRSRRLAAREADKDVQSI